MKNIYYLLVFSTIFYFHSALYGQNTAARADDETLRIIREADNEKGKETGALILLKDYHMTINEKGQSKMVIRILGKIYSKDALADYSQIPLNYNSYYEIPNLNYAYVIQTDGTLIPVPKSSSLMNSLSILLPRRPNLGSGPFCKKFAALDGSPMPWPTSIF